MSRRAALVLLLLLTGCNGAPKATAVTSPAEPALRIALGGVPATLDPALQRTPWERALASFYVEPLLRVAPDLGGVVPAAAASYDVSPDGTTYTFHLRPDGYFADGQPVTASDFVSAWRRIIDPRTASPHADLFAAAVAGGAYAEALDPEDPAAPIDAALARLGLAAPDPSTFVVTLARPSLWFKWIATVWAGGPIEPAGTGDNGPFRIQSVAGGTVTLVPNPHYRVRPKLRRILADEVARQGSYDLAPGGARRVPQLETEWIVLNTFRAPLDRVAVRQALAMAVDPAGYAAGQQSLPARELLPAGMPDRLAGPEGLQVYDPAAAQARLKSAGISVKGLHLLVENTPAGRGLGDFVRSQLLQHLGLAITVDTVDARTYAQRIGNRQFDMAGPQRWAADYPDPQDWLDEFTTGNGANAGRWQDPLFDDLVQLGDASLDEGARARAYTQAQLELDAEAPVIFLDQPVAGVTVSSRLRGLVVSEADPVPALGASALQDLSIVS